MFFRRKPRFRKGMLVVYSGEYYLLIECARWIRPGLEVDKQWVYDGILLEVKNGVVEYFTNVTCVLEVGLFPIRGLE